MSSKDKIASPKKDSTNQSPRNNNNNNNINIHTYIHLHHRTKTFYIPASRIETYHKLDEILLRENKSFSDWVFEHAENYVRLHEPGNPQQRLDTIMDLGKPYNANKCNMCDSRPTMQCFVGKKSVLLCGIHFEKKKSWFTGWRRVKR